MSRGPAKFRESEIRRLLRAAKREGFEATVKVLPDGSLLLVPAVDIADHVVDPDKVIPL